MLQITKLLDQHLGTQGLAPSCVAGTVLVHEPLVALHSRYSHCLGEHCSDRGNSGCSGLVQSHLCLAERPLIWAKFLAPLLRSKFFLGPGHWSCYMWLAGVSSFLISRGKGLRYPSPSISLAWTLSHVPLHKPCIQPCFWHFRNVFLAKVPTFISYPPQ